MFARRTPHTRQSGLTLVEVMVVVFVIGLVTSIAVLTLPSRDNAGERALKVVRQALQDAHDRSVLTGEVIGLHLTETGFRLVSWTGDEWLPIRRGNISFPRDVRVELLAADETGAQSRKPPERIIFNPLGLAEPVQLSVSWRAFSQELTLTPDGDLVDAPGN